MSKQLLKIIFYVIFYFIVTNSIHLNIFPLGERSKFLVIKSLNFIYEILHITYFWVAYQKYFDKINTMIPEVKELSNHY